MADIPSDAQVIVIGGGIIGCSTAYHLALHGCKDVLLLEKGHLTSGSTWHAAGLVGQLRASANITQLLRYSVALYGRLEDETGLATGWKANGSLRLCCSKARRIEIERQMVTARSFDLEMTFLTPREIGELCPGMSIAGLEGGVFVPSDGAASPSDLTMSLAKGARDRGVRILEQTPVTGLGVKDGAIESVITDQGPIRCERAVICAGLWSREIARSIGASIPLLASHHQYMITDKLEGLSPDMPGIRDPDRLTYYKEEVGGLAAGGYEFNPVAYAGTPAMDDEEFKLFPQMMEHFEQFMPGMLERFPQLENAGVKRWFNGVESFTEDTNFILGELPEVRRLFTGCGFNAMGIASAGGAGMALAQWVLDGEQPFDLWPVDVRRFNAMHRSDNSVRTRALEGQGHHYAMHWPHYEFTAARPLRRTPLYERLREARACFGAKSGWERPNWFAPPGVVPEDEHTFDRPNWFEHVAAEHTAARETAALFDQSAFAKFVVTGDDAEHALQRICAADVAGPPGRVTYSQMLNARGGIECDLTVARLSDRDFYLVTGTAMATHDLHHLRRHLLTGEHVSIVDVTSGFGVLSVMGPQSRAILQAVAEDDLSPEAFPFRAVREIIVAGAPVRAIRMTFVGELGWELHIPGEYMVTVFDALTEAGREHGLRNAGYRAIDSLRLEKQFCVWGAEITPDDLPFEAGLGFAIALHKDVDFVGRDALLSQRGQPLKKRLVSISTPDQDVVLLGRETIYRDDRIVGWLSSGGYGHTIKRPLGLGYVRHPDGVDESFLHSGHYELDVAGKRVAAEVHTRAVYDPKGERMRA